MYLTQPPTSTIQLRYASYHHPKSFRLELEGIENIITNPDGVTIGDLVAQVGQYERKHAMHFKSIVYAGALESDDHIGAGEVAGTQDGPIFIPC